MTQRVILRPHRNKKIDEALGYFLVICRGPDIAKNEK